MTASGGSEPSAADTDPIAVLPSPKPDAGSAVTALYHRHYRSLVGLAALLGPDVDAAEALVQDSFVAMHSAWRRLAGTDQALAYLHQAVVTRSRTARRHRLAAGTILSALAPGTSGASPAALTELERSVLVAALQTLAPRQREVLVLAYYARLPEAQIASAMRITRAAVKSHTTQAMSFLCAELRAAGQRLRCSSWRGRPRRRNEVGAGAGPAGTAGCVRGPDGGACARGGGHRPGAGRAAVAGGHRG